MPLILNGTTGVSGIDGSAGTPSYVGGDSNTGVFFPAADVIAFTTNGTEDMRIDSSGNVGIGTSSPLARLDVRNTSQAFNQEATISAYSTDSQGINLGGSIALGGNADIPIRFGIIAGRKENATTNNRSGYLQFATFLDGVGIAERMRIDSSGNVLIGTTSAATSSTLNVVGAGYQPIYVNTTATGGGGASFQRSGTLALYTGTAGSTWLTGSSTADGLIRAEANLLFAAGGSTERMRIRSNGQICINTTTAVVDANSKFVIDNSVASGVAAEFSNNTSGTACVLINNLGAATATLVNWYAANAFRSSVTWNGTNIIYGTPSDQRLKENIVDSNSALPLINDIKIRSFDWKENGNHIDFGVIAQELESVMPEAVLKGKDNQDGSIKESWSVDTSTLVPAMIKAIQEQQAMIEELKAEVAALKAK